MRVCWMILFLLGACLTAIAGDSVVAGEGGRLRLLGGDKAPLRLLRERVTLDLYHASYGVTAEYLLHNAGAETRVTLAFPESGVGDFNPEPFREHSAFRDFVLRVDNTAVPAARRMSETLPADGYLALWTTEVAFAAGQQRTIRVSYRAEAGTTITGAHFVTYHFAAGGWTASGETTLRCALHLPGAILAKAEPHGEAATGDTRREGLRFTTTWKTPPPAGAYVLRYCITDPGWAWVSGISGGPFAPDGVTLRGDGQPPVLDWLPQAMVREGSTLIAFTTLEEFLTDRVRKAKRSTPVTTHWDAPTKTATLAAGPYKLRYRLGVKAMTVEVDGTVKDVALPVAPQMSQPVRGFLHGRLYVPLAVTIAVLDGTVTLDRATRELKITVGEFWAGR